MAGHRVPLLTAGHRRLKSVAAAMVAVTVAGCALMFGQRWEARGGMHAPVPLGEVVGAQHCVPDVDQALSGLRRRGVRLTLPVQGAEALGGLRRHWQGIQRRTGASGSDFFLSSSGGRAAVIVVRLRSDTAPGAIGTRQETPSPATDGIVASLAYDPGFHHAGGLALIGNHLLIPMDGGGHGAVVLYDVADPAHPARLGRLHLEPAASAGPRQASSTGIARLADGSYLLVVGVRSSKLLEWYRSTDTLLSGEARTFRHIGTTLGLDVGGFQHLALLVQCDGQLFLAGTHNTAVPPPSRGRDHLHWYRLSTSAGGEWRLVPSGERWFECKSCNLAAAAGVYLTPTGVPLLYATGFGLDEHQTGLTIEEFAP